MHKANNVQTGQEKLSIQKQSLSEGNFILTAFFNISTKHFYDESEKAIAEIKLKNGEIFTMRECWYDYDILDEKREFSKVFTTYDAAMKYLKKLSRTKNGTKTHFAG